MLVKIKNKLKRLGKNEKGSELVEKIMMIAVSVAIGAVVIGVVWALVNQYSNMASTDATNGSGITTPGSSN